MEKRQRVVKYSDEFIQDIGIIYSYGLETFGRKQAELYEAFIWKLVKGLTTDYEMYPECRYLKTKNVLYRNIIIDSHIIIYRITPTQIEVLKAISSRMAINQIRKTRSIKIKK
jgi:plasmid stabilization system protein ParE